MSPRSLATARIEHIQTPFARHPKRPLAATTKRPRGVFRLGGASMRDRRNVPLQSLRLQHRLGPAKIRTPALPMPGRLPTRQVAFAKMLEVLPGKSPIERSFYSIQASCCKKAAARGIHALPRLAQTFTQTVRLDNARQATSARCG